MLIGMAQVMDGTGLITQNGINKAIAYVFGDEDAGLFIKITQWEGQDEPFEEKIIDIEAHPEAPAGHALDQRYRFDSSPSRLEFNGEGEGEVYSTSTTRLQSAAWSSQRVTVGS